MLGFQDKVVIFLRGANLKKLLLASSALVIGLGGQASAGPPPIYTWTGFYVGGHVGAGWDQTTFSDPGAVIPPFGQVQSIAPLGSSIDINASGFLGGVQGGYNYQFNNHFVVGVEGSFTGLNLNGFRTDPFFDGKNGLGIRMSTRTDTIGAFSGRVGYAWNNFMFYGGGGLAWTHNAYNFQNLSVLGNTVCPTGCDASGSIDRTGWLLKAGMEYALSQRWSTSLEYDHLQFDTKDVKFVSFNVPGADALFGAKQNIDILKVSVNYRFTPSRP